MQQRLTAVLLALVVATASASHSVVSRSGSSKPNPTLASSCSEWGMYEAHWLKLPECHVGTSSTECCELYDLMDKSIRIFKDKLGCKFTDIDVYSTKFSVHCTSSGRVPRPGNDAGTGDLAPSVPNGDDNTNSHGAGPIQILEEGASKTVGHGGDCVNCGAGGGCVGSHCGGGCVGTHCGKPVTPCSGSHCGGGCVGGNCGCTGGNCGCTGGNCGGGCVNCGRPVSACTGYNCGCGQCFCGGKICVGSGGQPGTGGQGEGQPNSGGQIVIPNDRDVCFHGNGVVTLQNGGVKTMRELRIGDVVHVGGGKFSEVFMFTHQDANRRSTYVNMTVGSGEWVMVTPTHYMYSDKGLQLAGDLKEGDIVEMDDGRMEEIVGWEVLRDKGLYNPQTLHGDVAVSGFRASTYTRTIEYETAHSLLAPLRAMYRICGAHVSAAF